MNEPRIDDACGWFESRPGRSMLATEEGRFRVWHIPTAKPRDALARCLAIIALLCALVALAGCACVTEREYRDAVQAWDAYRQKVSPIYRANVQVDPVLDEQSKRNRLAWDEDNALACEAAKQRAGLAPPAPKGGEK